MRGAARARHRWRALAFAAVPGALLVTTTVHASPPVGRRRTQPVEIPTPTHHEVAQPAPETLPTDVPIGADAVDGSYIVVMAADPVVAYDGGEPGLAADRRRRPTRRSTLCRSGRRAVRRRTSRPSSSEVLAAGGVDADVQGASFTYALNGFEATLAAEPGRPRCARQPERRNVVPNKLRQLTTDNTPSSSACRAPRARGRRATPARTSWSASSTAASGPSTRRSPTTARTPLPAATRACRATSATPRTTPTTTRSTCNNKLLGAVRHARRLLRTRRDRGPSCTTRPATTTATARTPRPRPPATRDVVGHGLRRRPRPVSGDRPAGPRRSSTRRAAPRAASRPTSSPRSTRPSPTASTSSTTRSAARRRPHRPRRAGVPVRRRRRRLGGRVRRQRRARRRDHRRPGLGAVGHGGRRQHAGPHVQRHGPPRQRPAGRRRQRHERHRRAPSRSSTPPRSATSCAARPAGRRSRPHVTGKIVLCLRGGNARVDKSRDVAAAGGAGMILYNPNDVAGARHRQPLGAVGARQLHRRQADQGVHRSGRDRRPARSITAGEEGPTRRARDGRLLVAWPEPGGAGIIKPDVTAPGVNILAGNTPTPWIGNEGPGRRAAVPVDLRHLDVEPARRRAVRPAAPGPPGLDGGDGQVGRHDDGPPGRRQGGRGHARRSVRHGRRPRRPGGRRRRRPARCSTRASCTTPGCSTTTASCATPRRRLPRPGVRRAPTSRAAGTRRRPTDLNLPSIGVSSIAGTKTVQRTVTSVADRTPDVHGGRSRRRPGSTSPSSRASSASPPASRRRTRSRSPASTPPSTSGPSARSRGRAAATRCAARSPSRAALFAAPGHRQRRGRRGDGDDPGRASATPARTPPLPTGRCRRRAAGTVAQDPDRIVQPERPAGTTAFPITVSGSALLRIALDTADLTPPNPDTDIDLYLYQRRAGRLVAASDVGRHASSSSTRAPCRRHVHAVRPRLARARRQRRASRSARGRCRSSRAPER